MDTLHLAEWDDCVLNGRSVLKTPNFQIVLRNLIGTTFAYKVYFGVGGITCADNLVLDGTFSAANDLDAKARLRSVIYSGIKQQKDTLDKLMLDMDEL